MRHTMAVASAQLPKRATMSIFRFANRTNENEIAPMMAVTAGDAIMERAFGHRFENRVNTIILDHKFYWDV